MRRPLAKALVERVRSRAAELGLTVEPAREADRALQLTAYVTTLATTYVKRSGFHHH